MIATVITKHRTFPELDTLLKRIEFVYHPVDVLLYGSRARGESNANSDWDLMVVLPDESSEDLLDPMLGWEVQVNSGVHADVLCCFESDFIAGMNVANTMPREIVDHAVSVIPR
ncbi:MAG: nucleotidyltransferase domain-containing protein [Siculibacillus sp.]|nr:nucleotidyltransferase domain-containing protein [Siculibacillus sp.]